MRRILVADDEEGIYRLYKKMLKRRYEVLWARDGQEAVDKYKELNPDLLVIDIMMPVKTGDEAIREIREYDPHGRIVVATSSSYNDGEFGVEVLKKGFSRDIFLKTVERNIRPEGGSTYKHLRTSRASRPFLLK